MTTYLICTQNRGQQRKHIAVCHQCTQNSACQAYQENTQNQSKTENQSQKPSAENHTGKNDLLNHVVRELQMIQALLHHEAPVMHGSDANPFANVPPELPVEFIKKTLKEIQLRYQLPLTSPITTDA